jgi:hypothetical protein
MNRGWYSWEPWLFGGFRFSREAGATRASRPAIRTTPYAHSVTIVGCFFSHGTPMMLGDFLITRGDERAGLRKKLRRLSPNVVVGWTGSVISAELALETLELALAHRATRNDVEAALLGLDAADFASRINLVGWVVDQQPQAFLWQSSAPSLVHWGVRGMLDRAGSFSPRWPAPRAFERPPRTIKSPLIQSLPRSLTTNLMADEVLGQGLRKLNIGHAYELLCRRSVRVCRRPSVPDHPNRFRPRRRAAGRAT